MCQPVLSRFLTLRRDDGSSYLCTKCLPPPSWGLMASVCTLESRPRGIDGEFERIGDRNRDRESGTGSAVD